MGPPMRPHARTPPAAVEPQSRHAAPFAIACARVHRSSSASAAIEKAVTRAAWTSRMRRSHVAKMAARRSSERSSAAAAPGALDGSERDTCR